MSIAYHDDRPATATAGPGHNLPPDPIEALRERLRDDHGEKMRRADDLLAGAGRVPDAITDDEMAGKISDFLKQIAAHMKLLDHGRVTEKEPHLSAGRAIDGFFGGPIKALDEAKTKISRRLAAFLKAKEDAERRRREEEARRVREEAERKAAEAAALEAAGRVEQADVALAEAQIAEAMAEQAGRGDDHTRARGEYGAVSTLAAAWTFEVEDRAKIPLDLLRPYLPAAAVDSAIRAFIKAGGRALPGVRIFEEAKALVR